MFKSKTAPMVEELNHVQEGKKVNIVYKTNDLSVFKSVKGNRIPNLKHIKRLASSIDTYGMKCNPIIVNEKLEVIDGQHRLAAAKEAGSFIYYIIIEGYSLSEVQTLNLNQKNWTKRDFMNGYADMGIEPYVKLRDFVKRNDDYNLNNCSSLCSNRSGVVTSGISMKHRETGLVNSSQVFEEGTWKGGDFELGQEMADKIRMIKQYYDGYNRSSFVGTMIGMMTNEKFDFNDFMHKLRLQPTALVDCANRAQYKTLIEDIYNYRRREKVNLRY